MQPHEMDFIDALIETHRQALLDLIEARECGDLEQEERARAELLAEISVDATAC